MSDGRPRMVHAGDQGGWGPCSWCSRRGQMVLRWQRRGSFIVCPDCQALMDADPLTSTSSFGPTIAASFAHRARAGRARREAEASGTIAA